MSTRFGTAKRLQRLLTLTEVRFFPFDYATQNMIFSCSLSWIAKAKKLGGIIMSKVYTVSELKDILYPIFAEHGVRSAVLFGSYSKGLATERSDVDLLVDSGLRGLAFFGLLEGVSSALGTPVDLIDVSQIERGSLIDQEISRSGVKIYGQ